MSTTNNQKYEVVAKYIKDVSFEIPNPDCFIDAAQNLESYSTKLDITSNPYKNGLVQLNCKFVMEAPETTQNKIHAELCLSILFKLIDPKMNSEEIKKLILVTIPSDHFDFMKEMVTHLFQKSGFRNFDFKKKIDFQELYNQQFTN